MVPSLAQVLNTLAHEIRTPLAVSQGYLKLYIEGRLTTPEDQRRALQQTREALGHIAAFCTDMGRVGALSETPNVALTEKLATTQLIGGLQTAEGVDGATWHGGPPSAAAVATSGSQELVRAVAVVARAAFDEARHQPPMFSVETADDSTLTLLAGTEGSVASLRSGPGDAKAAPFDLSRGGRGLTLIWASFVLHQHRVQTWNHQDHRASVGFRFPLVQA